MNEKSTPLDKSDTFKPYVKIIEEPVQNIRFRYECERRNAGSIAGVNSTPKNRTYPTIMIMNSDLPASIVVSCVTNELPHRPHPHKVFRKLKISPFADGVYHLQVPGKHRKITFSNLIIQCVRKIDIGKSLETRKKLRIDPFRTGFKHMLTPDDIDLNSVRLCFQVFLYSGQSNTSLLQLEPVVSEAIYNCRIPVPDLIISWLSHASASASGGQNMCILSEKVIKNDVKVRFFNDNTGWEAIAETITPHVHKQAAIVFKSPKYFTQSIEEPVTVKIQLKRLSDGKMSNSIPFQILPPETDDPTYLRRKRKRLNITPRSLVTNHLLVEASKIDTTLLTNNETLPSYEARREAVLETVPELFQPSVMPLSQQDNQTNILRHNDAADMDYISRNLYKNTDACVIQRIRDSQNYLTTKSLYT